MNFRITLNNVIYLITVLLVSFSLFHYLDFDLNITDTMIFLLVLFVICLLSIVVRSLYTSFNKIVKEKSDSKDREIASLREQLSLQLSNKSISAVATRNTNTSVSSGNIVRRASSNKIISSAPEFPEAYKTSILPLDKAAGWLHLKASVRGNNKAELQDSHGYISKGSAIVFIVADGAGSKKLSKSGADIVVKFIKQEFEKLLEKDNSINQNNWSEISSSIIFRSSKHLNKLSVEQCADFSDFGTTCIIIFANDDFIGCANVGDGRAGYLDSDSVWKSIMRPYKGDMANSTVFVTNLSEENKDIFIQTNVKIVRSRAIVALSDGPESVCWKTSSKSKDVSFKKIIDPNIPSGVFFEKISNQLISMPKLNVNQDDLDKLWADFLIKGNPELESQLDDKTMLFAIRG